MLELNKLYHMDCMEAMKEIPDKYFELAIVDPPYGIGVDKMNYVKSGAKRIGKAVRKDYSNTPKWDSRPASDYFDELFRTSQNQIVWGGNYFELPVTKSWIIWDKRTDEKYSNDFADCELAWCSVGVARVFRYMWSGMLQGDMKNKEQRIHCCQKPVALYEWLLKNYAKQGDKILDTHVGSASSLIACHNMGFDFMGFEIDADYHRMATERLEAVMAQMRLY